MRVMSPSRSGQLPSDSLELHCWLGSWLVDSWRRDGAGLRPSYCLLLLVRRHRVTDHNLRDGVVPFRPDFQENLSRPRENCCYLAKTCYRSRSMAILKKNAFSRRVPDLVTEELVAVLSRRASFEFKQLFDIVHENLRARNAASGGEEMLRLRAYEKLQNLVARGAVKKNGKKYKGLPSALAQAIAPQNGHIPAAAAASASARNAAIARAAAAAAAK